MKTIGKRPLKRKCEKMKKNKVKTCISLDAEAMEMLSNMSKSCNVDKSDIVNALIYEAYRSDRDIVIRYKWRANNE